ncbi:MAG: FAD-dependent oxidoreductase [Clostridia bacterium]|nr:FAD-dependent oxidoreductase [Clostridia bacterium]
MCEGQGKSPWQKGVELPSFLPLAGDKTVDVLIIGGGMAGVLTAYCLHQSGVDYALVEQDRVGSGVTGRTTAKLTAQHGLIYHRLLKMGGEATARAYWQANTDALERYVTLCADMDCDYQVTDHTVYSLDNGRLIEDELTALERIGCPAKCPRELSLPFEVAGAVTFPRQAQFHPLRFLAGILPGLHIYEHTRVRQLEGTTAVTDRGRIRAGRVIVATHFPFINKHGSYFLKLHQHRSYVLALEGATLPPGMYVDDDTAGLSFRTWGDRLLLGGGGHRTGQPGGNWAELRAFARQHYPDATETAAWATQDCVSLDGMPYVGQYSATTPRLYVATGFNKWGMTGSMAAATLLCELITGRHSPYAGLFSPSRSMLRPRLLVNGYHAIKSLVTPTTPRCPHLGCALTWNAAEHSWDCPCHGSRFDETGRRLNNPATGDLPIKKQGAE